MDESSTLRNDWPGEYHDSRDKMHAGRRGRHDRLAGLRLWASTNKQARLHRSLGEKAVIGRGAGIPWFPDHRRRSGSIVPGTLPLRGAAPVPRDGSTDGLRGGTICAKRARLCTSVSKARFGRRLPRQRVPLARSCTPPLLSQGRGGAETGPPGVTDQAPGSDRANWALCYLSVGGCLSYNVVAHPPWPVISAAAGNVAD